MSLFTGSSVETPRAPRQHCGLNDRFFIKAWPGGACGTSSHSLPPTAEQQRYLCHCEFLHLWSVISRCSWLISCRAAGKAAFPGWTWTHLVMSCPTLALDCRRRAENDRRLDFLFRLLCVCDWTCWVLN